VKDEQTLIVCKIRYTDVQKERKVNFLLHLMIGQKKLEGCLLHNTDIAVISECTCHLKARYLVQSLNMIGTSSHNFAEPENFVFI